MMTFVWVIFMVLMSVTAFYEKSSTDGDERLTFLAIDEIIGLFEIVTSIRVDGVATDKDVVDGDEAVFAIRVDELEEHVGIFEVLHGAMVVKVTSGLGPEPDKPFRCW